MGKTTTALTRQALAKLTEPTIVRLVGAAVFERGQAYVEDGMVKRMTWQADGSLRAKVEGMSEPYYDVTIRADQQGEWDTSCVCPYGQGICKHVAAVMLTASGSVQEADEATQEQHHQDVEPLSQETLQAYVEAASKEELAQLLMEQAKHDEGLAHRLALKISRKKQKTLNLTAYRQQIREALTWHGFIERHEVSSFTQELQAVAGALRDLAQDGYPRQAAELLEQFIDRGIKRLEDLDDSDGAFGEFIMDLYADWGKAWAQVTDRNRPELAKKVLARLERNEYGLEDRLILAMTEALGEEGLAVIEATIRPKYEQRLAHPKPKADREDVDEALFRWRALLQDVADARKDVERYIELCQDGTLTAQDCLEIARRLKGVGCLKDALTWLERGIKLDKGERVLDEIDLPDLRIELLVALGRIDQAQQAAWEEFCRWPRPEALDRLLSLTPKAKQPAVRQAAIDHVLSKGELSEAIELCLRERELLRLAERIVRQPKEVYRLGYGTLVPAAKALEPVRPEASIAVYRHLAFEILREKRSQAYHHALDYFRHLKRLYTKVGKPEVWRKVAARVKGAHRRKHSFIGPFEQLCTGP